MNTAPSTTTRVAGPRSVVAGRWRRAREVLAVVASWWPAVVVVAGGLVVSVRAGSLVPLALSVVLVVVAGAGVFLAPATRPLVVRAWWRSRWWWDARAAGLALNAERGIFGHDDGANDADHVVVAPRVRVRLDAAGRRYLVRPLPGQSLADFDAAVPRLVVRWAAASVSVHHVPGRREVVLSVVDRLPGVRAWSS